MGKSVHLAKLGTSELHHCMGITRLWASFWYSWPIRGSLDTPQTTPVQFSQYMQVLFYRNFPPSPIHTLIIPPSSTPQKEQGTRSSRPDPSSVCRPPSKYRVCGRWCSSPSHRE